VPINNWTECCLHATTCSRTPLRSCKQAWQPCNPEVNDFRIHLEHFSENQFAELGTSIRGGCEQLCDGMASSQESGWIRMQVA
jgi:hypothetical protein